MESEMEEALFFLLLVTRNALELRRVMPRALSDDLEEAYIYESAQVKEEKEEGKKIRMR